MPVFNFIHMQAFELWEHYGHYKLLYEDTMKQDLKKYQSDIENMKQQGLSIREIAKNLSDKSKQKISSSAVFRLLKAETTSAKPETKKIDSVPQNSAKPKIEPIEPGAPVVERSIAPDILEYILEYLDKKYGSLRAPTKANWHYVTGSINSTVQRQFYVSRPDAIDICKKYCAYRGWQEPQPEPQRIMHVSFKVPEERVRGMRIY